MSPPNPPIRASRWRASRSGGRGGRPGESASYMWAESKERRKRAVRRRPGLRRSRPGVSSRSAGLGRSSFPRSDTTSPGSAPCPPSSSDRQEGSDTLLSLVIRGVSGAGAPGGSMPTGQGVVPKIGVPVCDTPNRVVQKLNAPVTGTTLPAKRLTEPEERGTIVSGGIVLLAQRANTRTLAKTKAPPKRFNLVCIHRFPGYVRLPRVRLPRLRRMVTVASTESQVAFQIKVKAVYMMVPRTFAQAAVVLMVPVMRNTRAEVV
uniref:Uncharacterized protein n=1 Tax=Chromera velia CCMP2878 TaxID=1169474 RepID=A0A0G4I3X9_9ALVE|eukprot:Cvel_10708.t1-p1 / transcript=Cvel_10708.t1 / gene=Cvel_10708 / organism=Chromera_velia_CCMP2878 / gene_product=hypothetical protein / transcript_product=hypothetical protein / location=Cvel_scaffold651:56855-57637(-) / protein_length=261 / sequence_SO=supercontig / SO=protein_coding / is_pseudo=false